MSTNILEATKIYKFELDNGTFFQAKVQESPIEKSTISKSVKNNPNHSLWNSISDFEKIQNIFLTVTDKMDSQFEKGDKLKLHKNAQEIMIVQKKIYN